MYVLDASYFYTFYVSMSVHLSVGVLIILVTLMSRAKTAEPVEMPIWEQTFVVPRIHYYMRVHMWTPPGISTVTVSHQRNRILASSAVSDTLKGVVVFLNTCDTKYYTVEVVACLR